MTHVMATSGQKLGSIAIVVLELRPVEVGKKVIFCVFFSILQMISQFYGISSPLRGSQLHDKW